MFRVCSALSFTKQKTSLGKKHCTKLKAVIGMRQRFD